MPNIKQAIYSYLINQANFKMLVEDRIYPGNAPTSSIYPYIIYERGQIENYYHLDGQTNYYEEIFDFIITDTDALNVENVVQAFRDTFKNNFHQKILDNFYIQTARIESIIDGSEYPDDDSENIIYTTTVSVIFTYCIT